MKLKERRISRTIHITTCVVSTYERKTRAVTEYTCYVSGYTAPEEIAQHLATLYNTRDLVMLDYSVVRKQTIKASMTEEAFRLNADGYEILHDEVIEQLAEEIDVDETVEE